MIQQWTSPGLTAAAVGMIKHFETLRLDAYLDPVGVPTIGYGHTRGVRLGTSITPAKAEQFLRQDLNDAQADVLRNVKVPLNENEYGALVSLVFNIGGSAFARSRCLALLNRGDRSGAAQEFDRFVKGRVRGRPIVLRGLQLRRRAERELFCSVVRGLAEGDHIASAQSTLAAASLAPEAFPVQTGWARSWRSLEHLAAAAGIGTGLGAVPISDDGSGSWVWSQLTGLWQALDMPAILANVPAWAVPWIQRFAQFWQAPAIRRFVSVLDGFLQSHDVVAIAMGTLVLYLVARKFIRLFRLIRFA